MKTKQKQRLYTTILSLLATALPFISLARAGGGGGHGGFSGGGHGGGFSGGGGGGFIIGGGGGGGNMGLTVIIIIVIVVYVIYKSQQSVGGRGDTAAKADEGTDAMPRAQPFPEALDEQKVATSFYAIQDAWQRKDLSKVRKWISDGMYQRMTTQFYMMDILGQQDVMDNIKIYDIRCAATHNDGRYQTAEVAILFSMDDTFTSSKYPQFNESYGGDTDIEYWTFIKRTDSTSEKNLYDNGNCPNCGAPFEVKMGEIARCSNCNTLTNSAVYDWVLSEITQREDYSGGAGLANDATLSELMKNDPFFAVQRMEDLASNVFMQIMDVFATNDNKKLSRFADDATTSAIMNMKQQMPPFVFDRLYLNEVTLTSFDESNGQVNLHFRATATYRRVVVGGQLQMLDDDFVTSPFVLTLSRNKEVLKSATVAETVYSYECSACGAPYTDTTEDTCSYCGEPVVDKRRNWVLTAFGGG